MPDGSLEDGYTLTAADITFLRGVELMDDWRPYTVPPTALSRYNKAAKQNFVTDEVLQLLCDRMIRDQQEELEAAYEEKRLERLSMGDTLVRAVEQGEETQVDLILMLVAIEVQKMMVRSQEFVAAVLSGPNGSDVMAAIKASAERTVTFVRSRTGDYNFVPFQRY